MLKSINLFNFGLESYAKIKRQAGLVQPSTVKKSYRKSDLSQQPYITGAPSLELPSRIHTAE